MEPNDQKTIQTVQLLLIFEDIRTNKNIQMRNTRNIKFWSLQNPN